MKWLNVHKNERKVIMSSDWLSKLGSRETNESLNIFMIEQTKNPGIWDNTIYLTRAVLWSDATRACFHTRIFFPIRKLLLYSCVKSATSTKRSFCDPCNYLSYTIVSRLCRPYIVFVDGEGLWLDINWHERQNSCLRSVFLYFSPVVPLALAS